MARIKVWLSLSVALVLLSCSDSTGPGDMGNDRIAITNNAGALSAVVTYYVDSTIAIQTDGVGYGSAAVAPAYSRSGATRAPFRLKLEAEVAPPSINGQTLQANSVAIIGTLAVVGYNMRGEQYLGAIDVFDIYKEHKPVLRSRALFDGTDVNAVATDGVSVFAAEATSEPSFASPATFEYLALWGSNLVLAGSFRSALSSFAGTSAAAGNNRVYATSGNNGGLFAYDLPSFTLRSFPLHDARWVDVAGGKVVVVQGTPGQIAVFDEATLNQIGTFPFVGADIAESKSTVELVGGKAFIGAGSGGVQVLSASTGKVVGSVPRPDPAAVGLDPSVVVTNAVSVDKNLIFISNGEAGVYVAEGTADFATTGSEVAQQITMLGKLQFNALQSVNHVAYRNDHLFIAAGLGGLKIVRVQ